MDVDVNDEILSYDENKLCSEMVSATFFPYAMACIQMVRCLTISGNESLAITITMQLAREDHNIEYTIKLFPMKIQIPNHFHYKPKTNKHPSPYFSLHKCMLYVLIKLLLDMHYIAN